MTVRPLTISTGSTDLLYVALEIVRHIVMDHRSYVRLVDTHTERNRGHHNLQITSHKRILNGFALGCGHSGMVRFNVCPWTTLALVLLCGFGDIVLFKHTILICLL